MNSLTLQTSKGDIFSQKRTKFRNRMFMDIVQKRAKAAVSKANADWDEEPTTWDLQLDAIQKQLDAGGIASAQGPLHVTITKPTEVEVNEHIEALLTEARKKRKSRLIGLIITLVLYIPLVFIALGTFALLGVLGMGPLILLFLPFYFIGSFLSHWYDMREYKRML